LVCIERRAGLLGEFFLPSDPIEIVDAARIQVAIFGQPAANVSRRSTMFASGP
jgi:hypothetical protein